MCPFAQSERHDCPRLGGEVVPGAAAMVDQVVVGGEHPVGEPVVAHELPYVLLRVELGALGGSGTMVMLSGTSSLVEVCQPAWSSNNAAWRPGATCLETRAS